jgi:arabinan endo-1,5-alpha-L-arabinosidase
MLRILLVCVVSFAVPAHALDGEIGIHDPSTVTFHAGHYYTYGTGGLPGLVSDDGWTWRRGGSLISVLPGGKPGPEVLARGGNNSWAPDVIHIGDKFFVYYSAPGTQPKSAIGLLVGRTLDPQSPDYKWVDAGPVVWSDGVEDSNAIDPGVLLDPTDGKLWLSYGSYFGYIRLVELDPATGLRRYPNRPAFNIAINSEASVPIYHDGWYYLVVTHGSCCQGANSTYSLRMGRSRKVTGPYLDNMGVDMLEGGGKLLAGARGRHVGPGHFGLLDLGQGVQKFSMHYEADLDRGGISVLDIRPLLWRDGWPVAGDNLTPGIYSIESARTGTVLELAVQGSPVGGFRVRRFGGPPGGPGGGPPPGPPQAGPAIPDQDSADVAATWPATSEVRLAPALLQAQQKWTITPVANAGGYPGAPYFRLTVAGTERALTAIAGGELTAKSFTGAPEQLWRIDQLTDGTYRISAKAVPGSTEPLSLSAIGSSMPTLTKFDPASDRQRWQLGAP